MLIPGDMNAHSPMWNPHCQTEKNAGPLEELIESYELIINNDPDYATRLASQRRVSIIDLAFSSPELGPLCLWEIPEEYPSLSDHELILVGRDDMEQQNQRSLSKVCVTGWSVQKLLEDEKLLQKAKTAWMECSARRPCISWTSSRQDLDDEVEWLESSLSSFLDEYAKIFTG